MIVVRNVPGAKVSTLLSDNYAGAKAAIRASDRRLAIAASPSWAASPTQRFSASGVRGYRDALAEAGIPINENFVIHSAPSRAGGVAAVERMMVLAERPTAALCLNDAVAFGVCDGLRVQQYRARHRISASSASTTSSRPRRPFLR